MSKVSDLVEYFKLEAEFDAINNCTTQTLEVSDRSYRRRKIKVRKKWRRVREVGRGSFGTVWLEALEDSPGEERAVKEIVKDNSPMSSRVDYHQELLALGSLSKHENLFVNFHGWYESPASLYLVMEYVNLGDLASYVSDPLKEIDSQLIAKQLLEGLAILHSQGWAHRDLKPQNIFVVSGHPEWWIKIGDFGISKRNHDNETSWQTVIGTRDFMAPEITQDLDGDEVDSGDDDAGYTVAVDIWSLGCVIYWLLTKENPFPTRKNFIGYCRKRQGFPTSVLKSHGISATAIAFINGLMMPLPTARLSAHAALESAWILSLDETRLRRASGIGSTKQEDFQDAIPDRSKFLPPTYAENTWTSTRTLSRKSSSQEKSPSPSLEAPRCDISTLSCPAITSDSDVTNLEDMPQNTYTSCDHSLLQVSKNVGHTEEVIETPTRSTFIVAGLTPPATKSPASELNTKLMDKNPGMDQTVMGKDGFARSIYNVNKPLPPRDTRSSRGLRTWWDGLKKNNRKDVAQLSTFSDIPAIFGVPLTDSIKYANVTISVPDEKGESIIYGYLPIVVAKCGVFLKNTATDTENIFNTNGSEKRLKELQSIFDTPGRYGKGLDWTGYSVHDAAMILLRYFVSLPEALIPQEQHHDFIRPFQELEASVDRGFKLGETVEFYQHFIYELPPCHRQLLLYILDLLAVFASKSDLNLMTAEKLAGIFVRCGLLSKGYHYMGLEERIFTFFIMNQDHFIMV